MATEEEVKRDDEDGCASMSDSEMEANNGLPYTGILEDHDLERLHKEYDGVLMVAGNTMKLSRQDINGCVALPGSNMSYSDTKRIFKSWKLVIEKEANSFAWWRNHLSKKEMQPIYVRDLLDGLSATRWRKYQTTYKRLLAASRTRKYRERKAQKAREKLARDRREKQRRAADGLLGLKKSSEAASAQLT